MFRLLRYFSITSLVAFVIVTVLLAIFYRRTAVYDLIQVEESKNVALTQAFANSLWPDFALFLTRGARLSGDGLRAHPATQRLYQEVLALTKGLSVVKVKVYNLDGITVFSTEAKQIGEDKGTNAGFLAARSGKVASELTHRDTFSAFEGVVEDRDVLSSYLPIRRGDATVSIEGVFELYTDVTPLMQRIARTQINIILGVTLISASLYVVLFFIVRRADSIMRRQHMERQRTREELQAAKEYAENLIVSSLDMIISVDLERRIVEFNRAAEQAFGYGKAEVLGTHVDRLYADPSEGTRMSNALTMHGGFIGEVRNKRRNGEIFYAYVSASVMRDATGKVVGAMGISRDITERKRTEEALYEGNRRLEEALAELQATQQHVLQQERLRALGQMASGIAHDFNNALSPVLGFSELLLDRPELLENKEKVTQYLRMMNTSAQDAASAVRRLREFYRSREVDELLLPVQLNPLVEQAIMLTQPRWKDQASARGVSIRVTTDLPPVPLVAGNEAEIREVLTNLIFNAVDAMPEGGTINLRTSADGDHVVLEVCDTGEGMTAEVRQRCLEPFFSTRGKRGTGLGLAVVYGIIRRHHGELTIDSEPGRGTTVTIRLPARPGEGRPERPEEQPTLARRLRILVVDDEPAVREVVTEYLTGDGHSVETATGGREGLEKFLGGWFDLVITDQGMPEMAGDQLAVAVKRVAPNKPVVLLTGFGDLMMASGEKPVGVDVILSKPVAITTIRQVLAKVMAG
ncbi:MAG TPA: ATP-binding protein [Candidatus Methylomirabilis sp.]